MYKNLYEQIAWTVLLEDRENGGFGGWRKNGIILAFPLFGEHRGAGSGDGMMITSSSDHGKSVITRLMIVRGRQKMWTFYFLERKRNWTRKSLRGNEDGVRDDYDGSSWLPVGCHLVGSWQCWQHDKVCLVLGKIQTPSPPGLLTVPNSYQLDEVWGITATLTLPHRKKNETNFWTKSFRRPRQRKMSVTGLQREMITDTENKWWDDCQLDCFLGTRRNRPWTIFWENGVSEFWGSRNWK